MQVFAILAGFILIAVFFITTFKPGPNNSRSLVGPIAPVATSMPSAPLEIISPTQNAQIGNLLSISFTVDKAPADIVFRLTDTPGNILTSGTQHIDKPSFVLTTTYAIPRAATGILDISKAGDNHTITIPVNFPQNLTTTQIYFYNSDCKTFQVVNRLIPQKSDQTRERLNLLVQGPTTMESQAGLKTPISPSGRVNGIKVTNGLAAINFSKDIFSYPALSTASFCDKETLSGQLIKTFVDYSTISEITIAIDNRIPSNLQP